MSESLEYSSIQPKIPIILASGSESRKQMLHEAGIIFEVIVSEADEDQIKSQITSLPFKEQVIHLAKAKASAVSIMHPSKIVIGGDQMCVLGDSLLHKPGSKEKAIKSLRLLANQKHHQHSGVSIFKNGECLWKYSETVELKMHNSLIYPQPLKQSPLQQNNLSN